MATNRPDVLDPALLRPGRLDRKLEIPLPNETARIDIMKIHSHGITKKGDIGKPSILAPFMEILSDFEALVKLADGFNGADLRNVCTEAGMAASPSSFPLLIPHDLRYVCNQSRTGLLC